MLDWISLISRELNKEFEGIQLFEQTTNSILLKAFSHRYGWVVIKFPNIYESPREQTIDILKIASSAKDEIEVWKNLRHTNIATLLDVINIHGIECLVIEYYQTTLRKLLKIHKQIPEKVALSIALKCCRALEYTHSRGIYHLDLKPENILLTSEELSEELEPKITDFGASKIFLREGKISSLTYSYAAPEQVQQFKAYSTTDVYQIGQIIHEMLTGKTFNPLHGEKPSESLSQELLNLILKCTNVEPSLRISISELRKNLEKLVKTKNIVTAIEEDWEKQLYSYKVIPSYSNVEGIVYGENVIIEPECFINGSVYGIENIVIKDKGRITEFILCNNYVELSNCEARAVCARKITLRGSVRIYDSLVSESDLFLPPESNVKNLYCLSYNLEIGERSTLNNVLCKGTVILHPHIRITDSISSQNIFLKGPCELGNLYVKSNINIPSNTKIKQLYAEGSVFLDSYVKVGKIYSEGDIEMSSNSTVEEIACRNLIAPNDVNIKLIYANGDITINSIPKNDMQSFSAEILFATGNIKIPDNSVISYVVCGGEVDIGNNSRVKYVSAKDLKGGDNVRCICIRAEKIKLGDNCFAESLQAVNDINLGNNFSSSSWSIFTQRGVIKIPGKISLKGKEIKPLEHLIEYEGSRLVTAIISCKDWEIIRDIKRSLKGG